MWAVPAAVETISVTPVPTCISNWTFSSNSWVILSFGSSITTSPRGLGRAYEIDALGLSLGLSLSNWGYRFLTGWLKE